MSKIPFLLIVAGLIYLASYAFGFADTLTYKNERYGTSASFPPDLFSERIGPVGEDDGMSWSAPDGATLSIFGAQNVMGLSPGSYAEAVINSLPSDMEVTYRRVKNNWVVLSGYDGDVIYYERVEFGRSGSIHTLSLRYPEDVRDTYEPWVGKIAGSLEGP